MKLIALMLLIVNILQAEDSYKEFKLKFESNFKKDNKKEYSYKEFEKENGYTSFKNKIKETGKIPLIDESAEVNDKSIVAPN